jgi:hypothetical protein
MCPSCILNGFLVILAILAAIFGLLPQVTV